KCDCSTTGSVRQQCNVLTGECLCQTGYTGEKCNKCDHGYYGYPKCRRCSCDLRGTDTNSGICNAEGLCQCNSDGSCPCKANVGGKLCNRCNNGTFGLHEENPDGCTKCFCFGRSSSCDEAGFTWRKIRGENRTLTVDFTGSPVRSKRSKYFSNDIVDLNSFEELPLAPANLTKTYDRYENPIYWRLPVKFNGDKILSYGGYLRFVSETVDATEADVFASYPLVRIEGNGFKIINNQLTNPTNGNYEIRLHESLWKRIHSEHTVVTRKILMLTLQNVTGIFIKATDFASFHKLNLSSLSLDTADDVPGRPPPLALGVEKCVCDPKYTGPSCQNPNVGYYRKRPVNPDHQTINIDAIIGISVPCMCNSRSSICDSETGHCLDCLKNTAGKACDVCSEGFYGNPMTPNGECKPCACPSIKQNFAKSCTPKSRNKFSCECKDGYTGPMCNSCKAEFYGKPNVEGGSCKPCDCNREGSLHNICNAITGQCLCKKGITGLKCSQCEESRHILENNKCTQCDDCIQILLDNIDDMSNDLMINTMHLQNGTLQPPWQSLHNTKKRYINLEDLLEDYDANREQITSFIKKDEVNDLERDIALLEKNVDEKSDNLSDVKIKATRNYETATKLAKDIKETRRELNDVITSLKSFGKNKIDLEAALEKGNKLLKDIEKKQKIISGYAKKSDSTSKLCKKVNDMAKHLLSRKFPDPSELRSKIDNLNMRLSDMEMLINDIRIKNDLTTRKTMQNEEDYNSISKLLMEMNRDYADVTKKIEENNEQVKATHDILNKLQENYDIFTEHFDELYDLNRRLESREEELDKTIDNLTEYRNQIAKHVESLEKNITEYNTLFNFTTKEMDALAASKGFKIIMQTLKEANRTVHEARSEFEDILKNSLVPDGTDSIYVNTSIANANSERLVKRVENRMKQIAEARMKLHRQIPDIEGNNWRNGINNNELSEKVRQMLRNNKSKINIEDIIEQANSHSINMRNIYKEAMNINVTMQHDLIKKYEKCKNLTSPENTKKIQEDMHLVKILGINATAAQKNIMSLERQMTEVKQQNDENFNRDRSKLEQRLAKLRNTILKTEQIASTIFVAISGDDCSRSYKLINLEPSVQTDVKVLFVKDDFVGDLFTIKNQEQYMNLKIDETQAHLHWKFGKTEHQLVANINNADNEVLIHRMGSSMHLTVNGKNQMKELESDIFDLNPNNLLRIGMDYNNKVTGIPGCLKELAINGQKVGFWNFVKTQGNCAACQKNNTGITGNIKYRYNGNGYAITVAPERVKPQQINIKFKIWTFDEDALLLVAYHDDSYINISLQKGRIAFEMHYKNSTIEPLIVITKEKYNNGKQTQIVFEKEFKKMFDLIKCTVTGEKVENLSNTRTGVRPNDLFKIKKANLTFGGIPPDSSFFSQFAHIPPFLGILGEITTDGTPYNLQETANYGIELQSDDRVKYSQILFSEGNYVKLKTTANTITNFSFVLRTEVLDGFVMNLVIDEEVVLQFTLENGKLVVSQAGSPSKLLTIEPINDDKYHLIQYIRQKTNSKLVLDSVQQMKAKTQHSQTGSEIILNIGGLENKANKFEGLVKDVSLNNNLITVNRETYVNSDGAKIGRSKPQNLEKQEESDEESGMENATMEDMQQIDGCEKISYSLEPNAIKFGDAPNSFVRKMLKDSFWKREFKIEFEFRTFYKNGLLILAQGPNDYNLLEIKNGKVEFRMHGKRKKQLSSTLKIDDGNWHHVVIQYAAKTMKNKRKFMELEVDGVMQKVKAPPSRVTGSLYFGDTDERKVMDKLQPFRGCLRSLKINNVPQSLINDKTTVHHNIGQCFPNIEKGSYFRGDSYALYKRYFGLSNSLEFSFNFRTTEQNGVLVSISNIGNSPALSIELQNGAIVMSVDMGSRSVTNVTNNLPKFTICNNKWHHVAAKLSTELTVIVDGVEKSWVLSDMGLSEQIEAPLYIGGLPDSAPDGTLKIRENFKGCINNLTIGSDVVDWIDMEELNNVSLNSCPVILQ
ncbi:PREDICTED: laminin subunit alpha-1-like, partial [Nicrophorus vespilloides]|uniref:Laminin subunit alpha-1-like n=1 Tax=Nicrophorus vespilloides TaxID=110193 RepID=A0ABM1MU48_NICVS